MKVYSPVESINTGGDGIMWFKVWVVAMVILVVVVVGLGLTGPDYTLDTLTAALRGNNDISGKTVEVTISDVQANPMVGYVMYTDSNIVVFTSETEPNIVIGKPMKLNLTGYTEMFGVYVVFANTNS